MAKITDPDSLGSPFVGSPNLRTIQDVCIDVENDLLHLYNIGSAGSPTNITGSPALSSAISGITLQALYSYLKEEWRTNTTLIKYKFPLVAITEEKFDLVNGWDFASGSPLSGSPTKYLLRDAGWSKRNASNVSQEEYMGIVTLGTFVDSTADQAYYTQGSPNAGAGNGGSPVNFNTVGEVNQAVKIYGDATHGNVNYRTYFKAFLREQAKLPANYNLTTEQNITSLDYKVFKLPLANSTDLDVTTADVTIDANSDGKSYDGSPPFNAMTITYHGSPVSRSISGSPYPFSVTVNANGAPRTKVYEFIEWAIRQDEDIAWGSPLEGSPGPTGPGGNHIDYVNGKTADNLAQFTGTRLDTLLTNLGGVYILNYDTDDTNFLQQTDDNGTTHQYAFTATGSITFGTNAQADPYAIYRMFYADPDDTPANGDEFDTGGAQLVSDSLGSPISGDIWIGSPGSEGKTTGTWTTSGSTITGGAGYTFGSPADNGRAVSINSAGTDLGKRFIILSVNAGTATVDGTFTTTESGTGEFDVIEAQASVAWTFDYDTETEYSQPVGVDKDVTIVAIGLTDAQYETVDYTITRSSGQTIPVNPALERNYAT